MKTTISLTTKNTYDAVAITKLNTLWMVSDETLRKPKIGGGILCDGVEGLGYLLDKLRGADWEYWVRESDDQRIDLFLRQMEEIATLIKELR